MAITDYRNFDLLLARSGDRYRAFVIDAPGGEASLTFDLPFAPDELARLGGLGPGIARRGQVGAPGLALDQASVGQRLFEAIFREEVGAVLATSLSSVAQEGAGLRLRLRFEQDAADLAWLPWEILYDPGADQFVALGEQSPILRYLSLPRSRSPLLVEPPLRVLAVLSSPTDLPALDLDREWQAVQDALAGLVRAGKFILERLDPPSLAALQNRLLDEPVHVLHFVGHGVFDGAIGNLVLEDGGVGPRLVPGKDLAAILRNHSSLRLVYLNACQGALASGQSVFTGVAQSLVQGGLPSAVAMQAEISDRGAIELARAFYTALAAGRPVDAALTQARVALSVSGSPEWAIPVLFSRSPDNRLFDIREVLPTPACPYPGMTSFVEAQKDFFFGRDREIADAVARLRQHPFLAVVGPSGSGKSSLVYAGIIPALRRTHGFGPEGWTIHLMRPGDARTAEGKAAPLQALAERLGCAVDDLSSYSLDRRTLLFVDQFEEVFTLGEAGQAQAFLEALRTLISRPDLFIMLAVRADFYPDLMASPLWQPIRANRLELTPLGDDELWAAIVEPAARVGVTVDEALAVRLIADAAGESGVLPLVQETLVLLWDRVERRQLRLSAYGEMAEGARSGLQVAIDRHATIIYENLSDDAKPIARRIFLRLIQFGEGRADTRRQQNVAELRASDDDAMLFDTTLATLTAGRLLTTSGKEGGARRVDIAHEALIAGWPRLQSWLGERRAAEQTRRRLEAKAAEWLAAEKRGGLLDAYELQEAETWLAAEDARELGYSQDLADLVASSRAALEEAAAEKEAQRQRELAQAQKLAEEQRLRADEGEKAASSLRKRLIVAMLALAVAALAFAAALWLGLAANQQRLLAERRQRESEARTLAAQALRLQQDDPTLSLLLAGEAVQRTYRMDGEVTAEAEAALQTLLAAPHASLVKAIRAHDAHVWSLAQHPDGTQFVTTGCDERLPSGLCRDGQARVWDAEGDLLAEFGKRSADLSLVTYSPDGSSLLTADSEGVVQLWDAGDLREKATLPGYTRPLRSTAFSPDGQRIVTVGDPEPARLWSVDGQLLAVLEEEAPRTFSAVFSPDGARLLTTHCGSLDQGGNCLAGYARLWDVDGQPTATFAEGAGVYGARFDSSGGRIATSECTSVSEGAACTRGVVRIWDATGQPLGTVGEDRFRAAVTFAAFNDAGTRLLAHSGAEVALWTSAGQFLTSLDIPGASFWRVDFSPDGQLIVTASTRADPASFGLWTTDIYLLDAQGSLLATLPGQHEGIVTATVFTPDHGRLLTAGLDGLVQMWDTRQATGNLERALASHRGYLSQAVYSPAGDRLITVAEDGVRLWDQKNELLAHLEQRAASVGAARFNQQGTQFATLTCDVLSPSFECMRGGLRLWNADGKLVREVAGYRFPGGFDFAPNGEQMVISGEGSTALLLHADGQTSTLLTGHNGLVNRIAYSHDGSRFATSSDDGTVRIWDADGAHLLTLAGHTGPVRGVQFNPAGTHILTYGDDGSARLWNRDGDLLHVLAGHPGGVKFATFNEAGTLILAESRQGPARLWNLDGQLMAVIGENTLSVDMAIFDPSGEHILTVECNEQNAGGWCVRHTTNLWNTRGEKLYTVDQHWVEWAAFRPDGAQLATAGCDTFDALTNTACVAGGVWLWRAYPDVEALLAEATARAGRSLTVAECQQYLRQEQCP